MNEIPHSPHCDHHHKVDSTVPSSPSHQGHAHSHAEHHDHVNHASERRIFWALIVTLTAMVIGAVGGYLANSLALIADSGHMLADAGALALGLFAARQGRRPADLGHTYGHQRMPVLAGFVNGILLLVASAWISFEAVMRLFSPESVNGLVMMQLATVGLVANLISYALLHGGHHDDLNRRGAAAHVLSDLLGSVAALIAGLVIYKKGWLAADPIFSMFAATLVLRIGMRIVLQSGHILLEGTPNGMDLPALAKSLRTQVPGLANVHHLHAWSLSQTEKLMTLHAVPDGTVSASELIQGLKLALAQHGINHLTVQIEPDACAEPDCSHPESRDSIAY